MAPPSTRSANKHTTYHKPSIQQQYQPPPAFFPPPQSVPQPPPPLALYDHDTSRSLQRRYHIPVIHFDASSALSSTQGSPVEVLGMPVGGTHWEDQMMVKPLRHGFAEAFENPEYMKTVTSHWYFYWVEPRHKSKKGKKSEKSDRGALSLFGSRQLPSLTKLPPHIHTRIDSISTSHRLSLLQRPPVAPSPDSTIPSQQVFNPSDEPLAPWKAITRSRTVAGCLNLCLRLGYDPPDLLKIQPCATKECWIDPNNFQNKDKALVQIGECLQRQYENLSLGTAASSAASANQSSAAERSSEVTTNSQGRGSGGRWKLGLDPPMEIVQKICLHLRRSAKTERVLFHYNGHGVPKPTTNGDIWFFNQSYTQYIPTNISDLLTLCGSPMVYVWDCSCAGSVVAKVEEQARKKDIEQEIALRTGEYPSSTSPPRNEDGVPLRNTVPFYPHLLQLGACGVDEVLPQHAELPADIFTSCLTSPIDIALRYFWLMNPSQRYGLTIDEVNLIEGKLNDRRTPLGELNWIFNAVTDTIAWNCLSNEIFQRLFRYDMMIASLFRGFLLAQRVMKSYDCHPISTPKLPDTSEHPLWKSWDLAVDAALAQVPAMIEREQKMKEHLASKALADAEAMKSRPSDRKVVQISPIPAQFNYKASDFFSVELTAFEVWLEHATISKAFPPQLPLVLQVLLSQNHRLRALVLLCKFLDLGPRAVEVALGIGIFPYVLKLLQSPAPDLKRVMIYIWARILAVFQDCRDSLMNSHATTASATGNVPPQPALPLTYFVSAFLPRSISGHNNGSSRQGETIDTENRAMCAFILSVIARGSHRGQIFSTRGHVLEGYLEHMMTSRDLILRQWCTIGLGVLWDGSAGGGQEIKVRACFAEALLPRGKSAVDILAHYVLDDTPEIRAAALFAFSTLAGCSASKDHRNRRGRSITCSQPVPGFSADDYEQALFTAITAACVTVEDASPLVRKELVIFLSAITDEYRGHLAVAAHELLEEEMKNETAPLFDDGLSTSDNLGSAQNGMFTLKERLAMITEGSISDSRPTDTVARRMLFRVVYECLLVLSIDPIADVSESASLLVDIVHRTVMGYGLPLPSPPDETDYRPRRTSLSEFNHGSPISPVQNSFVSWVDDGNSATEALPQRIMRKPNGHVKGGVNGVKRSSSPSREERPTLNRNHSMSAKRVPVSPAQQRRNGHALPSQPVDLDQVKQRLWNDDFVRQRKRRNDQPEVNDPYADLLPLKSELFEISSQYFRDPQLKAPESDEDGSLVNTEREWRKRRNESLVTNTQAHHSKQYMDSSHWDEQVVSWSTPSRLHQILFHQFEPKIVSSDARANIYIHDWKKRRLVAEFKNSDDELGKVTAMSFVNEQDVALLMTGSVDGVVRLWRNYDDKEDRNLVTAFLGLPAQTPTSTMTSGMVLEWQQKKGHLVIGGNSGRLRIWDAMRELAVREIDTGSDSCVTCLTSDQSIGEIVVAGFGDGAIRVYDKREPEDNLVLEYLYPHKNWIASLHMQKGGTRELASAGLLGEVCLWDLRFSKPVSAFFPHTDGLTAMAVHDHSPVLATGSRKQKMKIWNMFRVETENPAPTSEFRVGNSQLGTAIETLSFHPQRLMFGVQGSDSLAIYRCSKTEL